MKKLLTTAAMMSAALSLMSAPAQAQDAATDSIAKHEIGAGLTTGDVILANIRYGYNVNKNFRLEAEAATGGPISNGGGFIFSDDEIDYWLSGFVVGRMPYGSNNSAFFARAGLGVSQTTAQAFTSQTSLFGPSGVSYPELTANGTVAQVGLGVEHFFNDKFGVRLEGGYAEDSSFDEISDAAGRVPRDTGYGTLSASAVVRF